MNQVSPPVQETAAFQAFCADALRESLTASTLDALPTILTMRQIDDAVTARHHWANDGLLVAGAPGLAAGARVPDSERPRQGSSEREEDFRI